MKNIIKNVIFSFLSYCLNENISAQNLQSFLLAGFQRLVAEFARSGLNALPPETLNDLANTQRLLTESGLLSDVAEFLPGSSSEYDISASGVENWLAGLKDQKVIHKGILRANSGKYLDFLDKESKPQYQLFVQDNLERLLRHVEVKRDQCFSQVFPKFTLDNLWLEKDDIAILFCRHSRRSGDLRMLNAAMKLNDWAFPINRKQPPGIRLARYLLALAEQERCVQELMQ
jgi:hypothetical protein